MRSGHRVVSMAMLVAAEFVTLGCSGSHGAPVRQNRKHDVPDSAMDAAAPDGAASFALHAPVPNQWATLLDLKWDLQPGSEAFWCKRVTVKDDFWIRGFRPIAPKGTHHVTVSKLAGPDGVWRCTGTMVETDLIFGVGVGSGDQVLPDNAAVKINAGDQLDLNVHVINTSNDPIGATSGVGVLTAGAGESFDEAGFVLAGATAALVVPPGRSTQHGACIIQTNASLLGVMPHMHLLGVHQDATLDHGTDSTTLFDADYDFNEQLLYWQPSPLPLEAGDVVKVACTYENSTPDTVYFGESTHNEMCFLGLYTTPPISRMNGCVN